MEKDVVIAGIGMGGQALLTEQVREDIENAQVIVGASRMLEFAKEALAVPGKQKQQKVYIQSYHPEEIAETVRDGEKSSYCVLMSGDTGFYSGAKKLAACLGQSGVRVRFHPGISSLSYLCAAFGKDYNEAVFASLHGRTENLAYKVRTNRLVFLLTDGDGAGIAEHLCEYGLADTNLYVGCQLSYRDEMLFFCRADEYGKALQGKTVGNRKPLLSMLIENPKAESGMKPLRDEVFIRGNVPMTKEVVRNQLAAMFDVAEDGVLYDIGAGTGAVSMTLAQKVPKGSVFAIECNPDGVALIGRNKRKMSMDQVHVIEGMAPDGMEGLPQPDGVFIGGSKGRLKEIIQALRTKTEQNGGSEKPAVVISAVTLETLHELLGLAGQGLLPDMELLQLQGAGTVPIGSYHRLEPSNPVWLAKTYL